MIRLEYEMQLLSSILPIVSLVVILYFTYCALCAFNLLGQSQSDFRLAIIASFVVIFTFMWGITEFLSLFDAINFNHLAFSWGFYLLACVVIGRNTVRAHLSKLRKIDTAKGLESIKSLPLVFWLSIAILVLFLGTLYVIAIVAAPNNWDSMTYHLSRVEHWIQNRNIEFFPTNILRQLHSGTVAETMILHLKVIFPFAELSNLVQFIALVGCVIGTSMIAFILGGDSIAQVLTGLAVTTIPMAILQSTSTQNDLVVAFFVVSCIIFLLLLINGSRNLALYLLTGLSLGLGVLTKPTAGLFIVPFAFWLFWENLRKQRIGSWLFWFLSIWVVAFVINLPLASRNYATFASLLGPNQDLTNTTFGVPVILSNSIRNASLHLATPNGSNNHWIEKVVLKMHRLAKIDIVDPKTTFGGSNFSITYSYDEDYAGNLFQFILLLVAVFTAFLKKEKQAISYFFAVFVGALLFSLVLKWQPWHSRLQLPLFVISTPITVVVIYALIEQKSAFTVFLIVSFLSIPYLVANPSRPLIGPGNIFAKPINTQYFAKRPDIAESYFTVSRKLTDMNCSQIGIISGVDDWEYPLWAILHGMKFYPRIEQVNINNVSRGLQNEGFSPCAVVSLELIGDSVIINAGSGLNEQLFNRVEIMPPLEIFIPDGQ